MLGGARHPCWQLFLSLAEVAPKPHSADRLFWEVHMQSSEAALALLRKHDIAFHTWGAGVTKTLEHLLKEIEAGESVLEEETDSLLRRTRTLGLNVFYMDGEKVLALAEEKAVFANGHVRVRDLDTSLGEKMSRSETAENAAYRSLREELGIHEYLKLDIQMPYLKEPRESTSYPGLCTVHEIYLVNVLLPSHLYKERYVEQQKDKTTYFVWKEVRPD